VAVTAIQQGASVAHAAQNPPVSAETLAVAVTRRATAWYRDIFDMNVAFNRRR
jgi:hypothetical protein